MDLRNLTDEELMNRVQQNDPAAYKVLFKRHRSASYGFLLRKVRDRELASDLFQETWLRVHRGRGTYRTGQSFKPWLFGIALNTTRDAGRKRSRELETVQLGLDKPAPRSDHAGRMTLESAIDTLPETLREGSVPRV